MSGASVTLIVLTAMLGLFCIFVISLFPSRKKGAQSKSEEGAVQEERGGLPEPTDEILLVPIGKKTRKWGCGHEGPAKYYHDIYGVRRTPKEEHFEKGEKCGQCMHDMFAPLTIHCAFCGHYIMPGDPVAVYGDHKKLKSEWKTYTEDKRGVIGCLRWNCCPTGAAFCGHWNGQGINYAFAHGGSAMQEVMETGQIVAGSVGPSEANISRHDPPTPPKDKKTD